MEKALDGYFAFDFAQLRPDLDTQLPTGKVTSNTVTGICERMLIDWFSSFQFQWFLCTKTLKFRYTRGSEWPLGSRYGSSRCIWLASLIAGIVWLVFPCQRVGCLFSVWILSGDITGKRVSYSPSQCDTSKKPKRYLSYVKALDYPGHFKGHCLKNYSHCKIWCIETCICSIEMTLIPIS